MHESWKVVAFGLALLLVSVFLYRKCKDPLRYIPGPFLAKFTSAWIISVDLSGNRTMTIHQLHKKHGRIVRIAPNQLCFTSPKALKDIYGTNSRLEKAPIYATLGFRSTFTTIDRHDYRAMKKRILPSFSPAFIETLEPNVHRQVANLVKCLDKRLNAPLDILPWLRMMTLNIVGEGLVGKSFGGLETEKPPQLLHDMDDLFLGLWVWWMFPVLCSVLMYSPFRGLRKFLRSPERIKSYGGGAYKDYLSTYDPKTRDDLVARLYNEQRLHIEKNEPIPFHVTDTGITEELTNLLFAGTDTTGLTLCYLSWELSRHPEWQLRLREELKQACGEQTNPPYSAVSNLPILDAVVFELLRLWPVAPASLQRITPPGGVVIDDTFVPENTVVSCQSFSEHRNPIIFPNPDQYNPQRWLDADKEAEDAMREQITLFGKGARACLGRRLALMEIKLTVTALMMRYNIEVGSDTTDKDMEFIDHFTLVPKGGRCILQLTKL